MQTGFLFYADQHPVQDTYYAWGERFVIDANVPLARPVREGESVHVFSAIGDLHEYRVAAADARTALLVRCA